VHTFWTIAMILTVAAAQPDSHPPSPPHRTSKPKAPAKPADPAPQMPETAAAPVTAVPAVPFPHPLITEILFAVPTGEAGDANQDGTRNVSGDEFVELHNPHDKPIQLLGYTITDAGEGSTGSKAQIRFIFPAFELPAYATVVVFNGNAGSWAGPVGDSKAAPSKPDDKFGGGFVFTMRISSRRAAFGNTADAVILRAPDGKVVHRVRWGKTAESAPDPSIVLDEIAPLTSKGSVTRLGTQPNAAWRPHADINVKPFSPGVFSPDAPPQSPKDKPEQPPKTIP
jgi:hypothetical protein